MGYNEYYFLKISCASRSRIANNICFIYLSRTYTDFFYTLNIFPNFSVCFMILSIVKLFEQEEILFTELKAKNYAVNNSKCHEAIVLRC